MKCRQCCLPTNVFAQQTTAMRLCGFLANLLLQSFWGDLLTYRVSNDHIITIFAFHLCYNFCTPGSMTVNLQAVDHCELRTTLKRLVENCKRKQFKRMILNELNNFSSKKFQGVHWRKKNMLKPTY